MSLYKRINVNVLHYDVDLAGGMQTQHKKSDLVSGNPVQLALLGDVYCLLVVLWSKTFKRSLPV